VLSAGERVPADGRIVESVQLQIQEASLTGESLPVGKIDESLPPENSEIPLGDRVNMGYMGTVITDGRGLMLVTETGMRTEVGKIGILIDEAVTQDTPLERRLEQLGRALIAIVGGSVRHYCHSRCTAGRKPAVYARSGYFIGDRSRARRPACCGDNDIGVGRAAHGEKPRSDAPPACCRNPGVYDRDLYG
jgi:magnesium-transporting ATPase (P-type)